MLTNVDLTPEQELEELAERFAHWRQTRVERSERIPQSLWDQAVRLSRVLPHCRVAKRLRLSPGELKKRRLAVQSGPHQAVTEASPGFVELPALWPAAGTSPEPLEVEFERVDGARMRLRYPASAPLGALVRAFLESR